MSVVVAGQVWLQGGKVVASPDNCDDDVCNSLLGIHHIFDSVEASGRLTPGVRAVVERELRPE
jgi:hypothetical protein